MKLWASDLDRGLSPRSRGSRVALGRGEGSGGSIPALTGKPLLHPLGGAPIAVYPRAHGEAESRVAAGRALPGLSPRSRGSRSNLPGLAQPIRSIPALTGKPTGAGVGSGATTVYPRAHGEAAWSSVTMDAASGLSPRSRGSQRRSPRQVVGRGSIPALTGKPRVRLVTGPGEGVYPRAHGEARAWIEVTDKLAGLSPRSRGSLDARIGDKVELGSIPALTGKPLASSPASRYDEVYPRAHGEAACSGDCMDKLVGLSPRSRGSRLAPDGRGVLAGSIPALTGKPPRPRRPRCGRRSIPALTGKPWNVYFRTFNLRSIPALTGKPSTGQCFQRLLRVYPRAHGEAIHTRIMRHTRAGLSPRSRGSRTGGGRPPPPDRSIPALTGKPSGSRSRQRTRWVYPRAHGEATPDGRPSDSRQGLSPRSRGSLERPAHVGGWVGSIPALTGKPAAS